MSKERVSRRQVLARARPFRHYRCQEIERAEPFAAQVWMRRKRVGEDVPQVVKPLASAGDDVLAYVLVRVAEVTLGIIDDADGRVTIGRDVDEAADRLRA